MSKKRKKIPKQLKQPPTAKTPAIRSDSDPTSCYHQHPVWRLGRLDFEGPFGWLKANSLEILDRIRDYLSSLENLTWREIDQRTGPEGRRCNQYLPVTAICQDAKRRLQELQLDDYQHLYELRLTNLQRIFGLRNNEEYFILWWDPYHGVCPVKKHS